MTDRWEPLEKAEAKHRHCGCDRSPAQHSIRHGQDADSAGAASGTQAPARPRAGTDRETRSALPGVGSIVQAGAFGAALGGISSGVTELARAKRGETTADEAITNVVKSSAQGATTMAVASVAAHVVRSHPMFSFIALAAAGVGAFTMLSGTAPGKGAAPGSAANHRPVKRKAASSKKPVSSPEPAPAADTPEFPAT